MGLYNGGHPVHDTGDGTAGTSGAASLDLELRGTVEAFYDVGASTDAIVIEGSDTGDFTGEERQLDETVASGSVTTGGATVSVDTAYQFVRVYAGSSFADADVNAIELRTRGL